MFRTKPRWIESEVSFLLSTNRFLEEPLMIEQCIQSMKDYSNDLKIEILVFSQHEIKIEGVTWVKENGRQGPIYGFNHLAKMARGKFLAVMTDDIQLTSDISHSIDFLENSDFEYKVCGLVIGGFCRIPTHQGSKYSNNNMVRFPFMSKECFKKLENHIFHPDLFYHAGDIWLSYFLSTKGNPTVESGTSISQIKRLKDASFEASDCNKTSEFMKNFPEPTRYIV
jgi:hypothetical protein